MQNHEPLVRMEHIYKTFNPDSVNEVVLFCLLYTSVQEILGINANQFRQIVMLPQGEFSRLLKAREEERVELLKSIFRMDLYNTLKDKVTSGLREIRGRHNDPVSYTHLI